MLGPVVSRSSGVHLKNSEIAIKRGIRLKESREEKHITQEKLSKLSGYTKNHISYVENGKRGLTIEAARIYSKILGVRENYLLCEDDFKTDNDFMHSLKGINHSEEAVITILKEIGFCVVEKGDCGNKSKVSFGNFLEAAEKNGTTNHWIISKDNQTVWFIPEKDMKKFFEHIFSYTMFLFNEMLSDASKVT